MKKIVAITVLVLTLILLLVSSVDDLTKSIADFRYTSTAWWGSEKFAYGDLYGLTYLPQFRVDNPKGKRNLITFETPAQLNDIDLYAMSDSYTWSLFLEPRLFYHVSKVQFALFTDREIIPVSLNHQHKNVLVLESSERNIRSVFADTAYLTRFLNFNAGVHADHLNADKSVKKINFKFKLKEIDPNIEFNLWDYRLITPIKELKARITHNLFNRVNRDVEVSEDQKYLLYARTIDTAYTESSFKPIGKPELDNIVDAMNKAYAYYKSKGFDDVYIAIIPNPVTVLYPRFKGNTYNRLIPLIQQNKKLKCKVIDAYTAFKSSNNGLYSTSDTHWTYQGEKIWLSMFNTALKDMK